MRFEIETYEKLLKCMKDDNRDIRFADWQPKEVQLINPLRLWLPLGGHILNLKATMSALPLFPYCSELLTAKPVVYCVNLTKKDFSRQKNKWLAKIKEWWDGSLLHLADMVCCSRFCCFLFRTSHCYPTISSLKDWHQLPWWKAHSPVRLHGVWGWLKGHSFDRFLCFRSESLFHPWQSQAVDSGDRDAYFKEAGVPSMLDKVRPADADFELTFFQIVQHTYSMLNLIHFFTVGKDEVRSWTVRKNCLAPQVRFLFVFVLILLIIHSAHIDRLLAPFIPTLRRASSQLRLCLTKVGVIQFLLH